MNTQNRKIVPGRILYPKTALPDPNGVNAKIRAYIVISDVPEIQNGEPYWCVATTSLIRNEADEVSLTSVNDGFCCTKFTMKTVAKVCWHEWAFLDEWTVSDRHEKPAIVEQLRIRAAQCRESKSRQQAIDSHNGRLSAAATGEGVDADTTEHSIEVHRNSGQSLRDRIKSLRDARQDQSDPPSTCG